MRKGTAESYHVFTRTWWARNGEPHAGRKTTLSRRCTYSEARAIAKEYNDTHDPGQRSRKAEFERE